MKIDIQEIIYEKIKDMEENRVVEKAIEETIEKTIIGAVTKALDSYSVERLIKDKVEKEVSEVVSEIGFTAYNGFIAEKVKKITEEVCNADIAEKIQNTFNDILVLKKDSVKLSEICDKYREWICDETDEDEQYILENFYVSVEEHEEYKWLTFKFGKEKPKYSRRSDENSIEFIVHRDYKNKNTGWISRVYIDGVSTDDKIKLGNISEVEALLLNILYNKTPIIIDVESEDDIDNYFDVDI